MGHWVTLDDDQHVYISDGGKILATRGQISSAAGGKERGRALAARSKAAVGKATGRTARAVEHARAAGPSLREQADKARAAKGTAADRVEKARQRAYAIARSRTGQAQTAGDKGTTYERLRPRLNKLQSRIQMLTPRWARMHVEWHAKGGLFPKS